MKTTIPTTQAEHTPGPWHCSERNGHITGQSAEGAPVSVASVGGVSIADARLIAAAPDLLAALKRAEALLAISYNPGIEHSVTLTATHCQWATNEARAAILKAEGGK